MLCAIYDWLTEHSSKEGIEKTEALLWKVPAGIDREVIPEQDPKWSKEAMANEFMANLARSQARGAAPIDS